MSGQRLGFVGVGRMGGRMVRRLLAAGHTVVVHDPDPAACAAAEADGAEAAPSLGAVADAAEIVFASLPSPETVETAALGADGLGGGGRMRLFVDTSTTGPRTAARVAEGLARRGVTAVDAPVTGGLRGAGDGTLAVMVSGPRAAFAELEPVLGALGPPVYVGAAPGAAQTLKLANNLLTLTAMAISSEAMVMGAKAGLDPEIMLEVINAGTGRNSATVDKFPRAVLPRTFDFGFATGLAFKDIRLCLDEAEALGVPMVVGSAVRQMLCATQALYGPDSDFTCLVKTVEAWAKVEVGGKAAAGSS